MNKQLILALLFVSAFSNAFASYVVEKTNIRLLAHYTKETVEDKSECLELCKNDESCVASSFRSSSGSCSLHDRKLIARAETGSTSYFKYYLGKLIASFLF